MKRHHLTPLRRLAIGTVALALVAAACGSDDDADDAPVVDESATTTAPVSSDAPDEDAATTTPTSDEASSEPAATAGAAFLTFSSGASFADTEAALEEAIAANGMMELGDIDQAGALSATGLELAGAHSYFVGNPGAGSMFFEVTPAIGSVIPLQMHVWDDGDGNAFVSYFDPAPRFAEVDPMLADGGQQMAEAAAMIAAAATGSDAGSATVTGTDLTHEWVVVDAPGGYDETIDGLRQMVADSGMMVLGELDEAGALRTAGLDLDGSYSLFIGNPSAGVMFFEQTPAIGAVIPVRVQVWVDDAGTHVGYFDPTTMFSAVDPTLADGGAAMAEVLATMTAGLSS